NEKAPQPVARGLYGLIDKPIRRLYRLFFPLRIPLHLLLRRTPLRQLPFRPSSLRPEVLRLSDLRPELAPLQQFPLRPSAPRLRQPLRPSPLLWLKTCFAFRNLPSPLSGWQVPQDHPGWFSPRILSPSSRF